MHKQSFPKRIAINYEFSHIIDDLEETKQSLTILQQICFDFHFNHRRRFRIWQRWKFNFLCFMVGFSHQMSLWLTDVRTNSQSNIIISKSILEISAHFVLPSYCVLANLNSSIVSITNDFAQSSCLMHMMKLIDLLKKIWYCMSYV